MRDVTDNVTGDMPGVEQKRGRGRPPKAHAMSNAERQAAFRARRKAQQPVETKSVTKRMTVTEMLSDVDAYDECRLEVDALREQLENMRQQCVAAVERHGDAELRLLRAQSELAEARKEAQEMEGYVNARDRENDHLVEVHDELVRVRYDLSVQLDKNVDAEREIERLCKELTVTRKGAAKSVTTRNAKSSSGLFAEIKRSSKYYGQSERGELFPVSLLAGGEYQVHGGPGGQYRLKDVWLWALDLEGEKVRLG